GRLRIWGVNVCFGANFPSHEDAGKVAAHLAKLGVNGVRFHHHDTSPAPRGILGPVRDGRRSLAPEQLDRQDYFLSELHRHGIYANLNLHVGREFTAAEGFDAGEVPREVRYDKYLLYFEPRMRVLFKAFCRDYLTHVNPYRRLGRTEDPGIAMIEITNENAFNTQGAEIATGLPPVYRDEFQRQWNQWLKARYPSTTALKAAWGAADEPLRPAIAEATAWNLNLGGWRLHQSDTGPVRMEFNQPGPATGLPAVKLDVVKAAPELHLQELQYPGLQIQPGRVYTITFWARAAAPRTVYADVSNAGPQDWSAIGFSETIALTSEWQRVQRVFRATDDIPGNTRICFKFGGSEVDFWLAGVSLRPGGEWIVLPEGQSLEAANIGIPVGGWAEPAQADVRRFMADTEAGFIREITDYLKHDLGVRVPVTASQITYHGAKIVADTCDYADIHAYWQHPRFPRRPWDAVDWNILNTPMEAAPGRDALLGRAPWRLLDRPFTISEWNIPDPNDYAASVVPFAAMVAALQDWDGVFFFDYQSGDGAWYADHVQRFFSFNGNPAKLALFTACANLYRRGDLAPLRHVSAGTVDERLSPALALSRRIGIDPGTTAPAEAVIPSGAPLASPDGAVVWDATQPEAAHVSVVTPKTVAVWGLIGGREFDLGGVRFSLGQADRDYAVLLLTSMDGQPIASSKRLLLATVGSAENVGMKWNADRTSVGNDWGTGPAQVNAIPVTLEIPGRRLKVTALDGRGLPLEGGEAKITRGASRIQVGPEDHTLWYALTEE
ncbi:MAG: carbohydrate binding domain-containing protein, partial [Verrucomicrobiae bacterium]|nr:carbohydrate binding domain-containing protein [Verrucomicrobiae bacterium]